MNVLKVYRHLSKKYGPQNWWPIYVPEPDKGIASSPAKAPRNDTRTQHALTYGIPYRSLKNFHTSFRDPYFEIAIGAILAQNVSWSNAAKAIQNLYDLKALKPRGIISLSNKTLEKALFSTRYYAQKAKKLKQFAHFLVYYYASDILNLKKLPKEEVRVVLLDQWGIGPETADSIMLYALNIPIFVIDVYTKRFCAEQGIVFKKYDDYRIFFESNLSLKIPKKDLPKVYQEFHALLVANGQKHPV